MEIITNRDDHRIAWFTALAITIHIIESSLPALVPGVKPGLANIVTIIVVYLYGWRMAAWISLFRVLIGSILLGSFLSPTFILSLSGALASIVALAAIRLPFTISPFGLSILAALAHMTAQFYIAYYLFVPHPGLFVLLPVLLTLALFLGMLNGIISIKILTHLKATTGMTIHE